MLLLLFFVAIRSEANESSLSSADAPNITEDINKTEFSAPDKIEKINNSEINDSSEMSATEQADATEIEETKESHSSDFQIEPPDPEEIEFENRERQRQHEYSSFHKPHYRDEERVICVGNHTTPSYINGKPGCGCERGYIGKEGDVNGTDCWKCENPCSTLAKCVAYNICKCIDGMDGDGFDCYPPPPKIKNIISPLPGTHPLHVIVQFEKVKFQPYLGFCKFGNIKTAGHTFTNNSFACIQPESSGSTKLSISFDGSHFSDEQHYSLVAIEKIVEKKEEKQFDGSELSHKCALVSIVFAVAAFVIKFITQFKLLKKFTKDPLLAKVE